MEDCTRGYDIGEGVVKRIVMRQNGRAVFPTETSREEQDGASQQMAGTCRNQEQGKSHDSVDHAAISLDGGVADASES
jgi:hypothetical protein